MIIDSIQNGIVIDHITAGKAMELYNILGLDKLDCTVAILKNVTSGKLGRKDIIKIDREMDHHHREYHSRGPAPGEAEPQAAGADPGRAEVQEPPLHHLCGAGAASGIPADRSGQACLPLHLLRD